MIVETNLEYIATFRGFIHFNEKEKLAWKIINRLYNDCLINDDSWHFFYEGDFSVIRFDEKSQEEVCRILKRYNVQHSIIREWVDSSDTVEKYKEHYTKLFHIFSLLAIQVEYDDMGHAFDRIAHSFCNHNFYKMKQYRDLLYEGDLTWEQNFIMKNALNRALYNGKILQQRNECKYYAEKYKKEIKAIGGKEVIWKDDDKTKTS